MRLSSSFKARSTVSQSFRLSERMMGLWAHQLGKWWANFQIHRSCPYINICLHIWKFDNSKTRIVYIMCARPVRDVLAPSSNMGWTWEIPTPFLLLKTCFCELLFMYLMLPFTGKSLCKTGLHLFVMVVILAPYLICSSLLCSLQSFDWRVIHGGADTKRVSIIWCSRWCRNSIQLRNVSVVWRSRTNETIHACIAVTSVCLQGRIGESWVRDFEQYEESLLTLVPIIYLDPLWSST